MPVEQGRLCGSHARSLVLMNIATVATAALSTGVLSIALAVVLPSAQAQTLPPTQATPTTFRVSGPAQAPQYSERRWVKKVVRWLVTDIRTVDRYMLDGIAVESALGNLADNYDRLLDSKAPPGMKRSKYYARVATLADFTYDAADAYYDDPVWATARYSVVRKETKPVLKALNSWLRTSYRLPRWRSPYGG